MAKQYIKGETHRETVGMYVLSAKKQTGAPRWVQISCTGKDEGKAVMGAISANNPNWRYEKADSELGNILAWGIIPGGSLVTGDWKTFRVRTASSAESDALVKDIGACIEQYAGYSGGGSALQASGGSGTAKTNKTTIYIVAGIALAVVVAILFTRKKN